MLLQLQKIKFCYGGSSKAYCVCNDVSYIVYKIRNIHCYKLISVSWCFTNLCHVLITALL